MDAPLQGLGLGVAAFASTNIDDLFLLAAFFADPRRSARRVVLGQFLGMGLLTLGSMAAALLALAVPEGWIGLLGLFPLLLGLRQLMASRAFEPAIEEEMQRIQDREHRARDARSPDVLAVAGVTIANGADNLGVYIPLFSRNAEWLLVYGAVFAVMTALWCLAAYRIMHHPRISAKVGKYGQVTLPLVLIALGLYILSDARILLE